VARREHQAQEVVADIIVERGVEVRRSALSRLELVTELFVLSLEQRVSPEEIDGPMLRGGHEPRAGIARDPRLGPLLECSDERILGEVLGRADITHDPRETSDEPRRFDAPDCVDRATRFGVGHAIDQTIFTRSAQADARCGAAGTARPSA
jgi:hypothetical protein